METKTVRVGQGKVLGLKIKNVWAWQGIPYARAPVGELRFRRAQPLQRWKGTYRATGQKAICPQANMKHKPQDEDCLTLNIWAPFKGTGRKAVLFYVHGGSFCSGSGTEAQYNGAKLAARRDVIVVTFNYRLGALGFLDFSFLGDSFETNCGLSDVLAALRWVHKNIGAFGGDAGNITVVGQSAGGIIASALVTMPQAQPYISRAIVMSGGPVWMHEPGRAQEIAQEFIDYMKIGSAKELRAVPAAALVSRQKKFIAQCRQGEGTFSIVVDGDLVPDYPIPASRRGGCANIPVLIGNTREELSFASGDLASRFMVVRDIALGIFWSEPRQIRNRIAAAYSRYGKQAKGMLISDYIFKITSLWFAQARNAFADTWMYRFDYAPAALRMTKLNAVHSVDISFLFGNHEVAPGIFMFLLFPFLSRTRRVTDAFQKDFTDFAKTGALPWPKCEGKFAPAKCYDSACSINPVIDPAIVQGHKKSEFKRKCFAGVQVV